MGFYTDGDDAEDDEANYHSALDVVGYEGDFEAAEGWTYSLAPWTGTRRELIKV